MVIVIETNLLMGPDSLVQSRNLCFPRGIVIAKDNKATLDGFRPLYNQFKSGEVGDGDNDNVDTEAEEEMSESGSNREDDESLDDTSDDENNE